MTPSAAAQNGAGGRRPAAVFASGWGGPWGTSTERVFVSCTPGATDNGASSEPGRWDGIAKDDIRTYSLADLNEINAHDAHLATCPNAPEYEVDEEFWENALVVRPGAEPVPLDQDLLAWFRRLDEDYEARIKVVLRAWVDAQEQRPG